MANKIKAGKTYTSPKDSERDLTATAYAVVTQININHNRRDGLLTMEVYPRVCTREERASHAVLPIDQFNESINEAEHDLYFAKTKFTNGQNPQKMAYKFFEEKTHTVDDVEVLKYDIWTSDEV